MRVPVFPPHPQHVLLFLFTVVILVGMKWYLVVLICISLMTVMLRIFSCVYCPFVYIILVFNLLVIWELRWSFLLIVILEIPLYVYFFSENLSLICIFKDFFIFRCDTELFLEQWSFSRYIEPWVL
jgi:hypothetical protein